MSKSRRTEKEEEDALESRILAYVTNSNRIRGKMFIEHVPTLIIIDVTAGHVMYGYVQQLVQRMFIYSLFAFDIHTCVFFLHPTYGSNWNMVGQLSQ